MSTNGRTLSRRWLAFLWSRAEGLLDDPLRRPPNRRLAGAARIGLPGMSRFFASATVLCLTAAVVAQNPSPKPLPGPLEGRVFDPSDRYVIEGAAVAVAKAGMANIMCRPGRSAERMLGIFFLPMDEEQRAQWHGQTDRITGKTMSDSRGRFHIDGLESGVFNVVAAHPEHGIGVVARVEVTAHDRWVEVVLEPPTYIRCAIHGIEGPGSPCAMIKHRGPWPWQEGMNPESLGPRASREISVSANPCAAEGWFHAGPLPAGGEWEVTVFGQDLDSTSGIPFIVVPVAAVAGETTTVEIDLNSGVGLSGYIVDEFDQPLPRVVVTASLIAGDGPPLRMSVASDEEGLYVFQGLPPAEYELTGRRWPVPQSFPTPKVPRDVGFTRIVEVSSEGEQWGFDVVVSEDPCDIAPDLLPEVDVSGLFQFSIAPHALGEFVDQLIACPSEDAADYKLRIIGMDAIDHLARVYDRAEESIRRRIQKLAEHIYFANNVPAPYGYLGFSVYFPDSLGRDLPLEAGTRAIGVGAVTAGSPVAVAGLRSGDVIVAVDGLGFGEELSVNDILDYLREFEPGEVVTVEFYRDRELYETDVEVGYRPVYDYNAVRNQTAGFADDYLQACLEFPRWWKWMFGTELDESARQYSPLADE